MRSTGIFTFRVEGWANAVDGKKRSPTALGKGGKGGNWEAGHVDGRQEEA